MTTVSPFFLTNNFGRLKKYQAYIILYLTYLILKPHSNFRKFCYLRTRTLTQGRWKFAPLHRLVILSSLTFHQWFTLWSPAHVPSWRVKSRCADLRSASSCHCDCALFGVLSVWSAQSTDHLILHTGELIISDLFCVIYSSGHFLYPG